MSYRLHDEKYIRTIVRKVIHSMPPDLVLTSSGVIRDAVVDFLYNQEKYRLKSDIVEIGKRLYEQGFLPGAAGNISVKLSDGTLLMTSSGISKGRMDNKSIVHIDLAGNLLEPTKLKISSEAKMHLFCYRMRPDIGAIVHTHPPFATGFAAAGISLDKPLLPEAVLILGSVPLASYGTPSTEEVPDSLKPYILNHDAFLLANHGALTLGKNLKEASHRMETLEFLAKVTYITRGLGSEKILSARQVEDLYRAAIKS
jgi:L-fuculose-phosphate aldolase